MVEMETCHLQLPGQITAYNYLFCWLCALNCDTCSLSRREQRCLDRLSPWNISYPRRHVTRHNTPQHDSTACTQGVTGLGWGQTAQNLYKTKLVSRAFFLDNVGSCWSNVLCQCTLWDTHGCPRPMSWLGREMLDTCSTLLVHCLTVLMSSWMTRSMHFRQGSFSLMICFFTMASNARSGVNRPVLKDIHTRHTWRHEVGEGRGSINTQEECETGTQMK